MTKKQIISTKEIAGELRCTPETVRRWFREGKLDRAFKVAGPTSPIKMYKKDLDRLMSRRGKVGA